MSKGGLVNAHCSEPLHRRAAIDACHLTSWPRTWLGMPWAPLGATQRNSPARAESWTGPRAGSRAGMLDPWLDGLNVASDLGASLINRATLNLRSLLTHSLTHSLTRDKRFIAWSGSICWIDRDVKGKRNSLLRETPLFSMQINNMLEVSFFFS